MVNNKKLLPARDFTQLGGISNQHSWYVEPVKRMLNLNGKEEYIFLTNFTIDKENNVERLFRKIAKEHSIKLFIHSVTYDNYGRRYNGAKSVWAANTWDKDKWDKVQGNYDKEWKKVFKIR